jgi:hypothetical protein
MTATAWCCPPPGPGSQYLHFTNTERARLIVAQRRLVAGFLSPGVCAVPVGGRLRRVSALTDGVAYPLDLRAHRLQRVRKDAAVLFTADRLPDMCAPTEAQWHLPTLALAAAEAVSMSAARELLDDRLRLAYREPDGETGCISCRFSSRCRVVAAGAS